MALAGIANAKRLLFSAEPVDGATAQAMGLVDKVAADPMEVARELIAPMRDKAPLAIAGSKAILNALSQGNAEAAMMEALIDAATTSRDYREALAAFREKRKPVFRGE